MKRYPEIEIKKAKPDDAEKMIEYLNRIGGESTNLLFGENEFHLTVEEEKMFLQNTNTTNHSAMMLALIGNKIVAIGSILSLKRKRLDHIAEISVSVSKDTWNQGVGTLLMKALIEFAKGSPTIEVITLDVKTDNKYAIQMYEKLGFVKVGMFEKMIKIDNTYYDVQTMNLYL